MMRNNNTHMGRFALPARGEDRFIYIAIFGFLMFVAYIAVLNHLIFFSAMHMNEEEAISPTRVRHSSMSSIHSIDKLRKVQANVDDDNDNHGNDNGNDMNGNHVDNNRKDIDEEEMDDEHANAIGGGKSEMDNEDTQKSTFVPTLRNKKILIEITTVGMRQFALLEMVFDSIRDMCECGAHISLHITTANCDPTLVNSRCTLTPDEEKMPKNYPPDIVNQLNERFNCRDPDGRIDSYVHIKSVQWGKRMVDFHRKIFYDNIDNGYDIFIHTEEDEVIRPTSVLAFLDETEKLRQLVGDERLTDYSMGFVRYENQRHREDMRRVIWEFEWDKDLEIVDHPGLNGNYFTTPPPWHHQGMFMATREQLLAWAKRGPDCHFDKVQLIPAYHRERVSGGANLYDAEVCNITQLLPLDSFDDFLIHHLPDQNNRRTPNKVHSTMDMHKKRMNAILQQDPERKLWIDEEGNYNGLEMWKDEHDPTKSLDNHDISEYWKYLDRGGMLTFTNYTSFKDNEYYDKSRKMIYYEGDESEDEEEEEKEVEDGRGE
mmetsp:Transcript_23042/g.32465  ORF Transcript_23042/g.32465 Transcript_23042/m.32465 type:complete len:543 (+) Transcript_23042:96-1724(+)